jgi:hypothetical protein
MLVLFDHGLVFLEVPKTASTSVRRMLEARIATPWPGRHVRERHMSLRHFRTHWADRLAQDLGRPAETFCVVRDPVDRLESWYRYRQRDSIAARPTSTRGLSFAGFLADCLADTPPPHARVGSQSRFTGFAQGRCGIDHVFDYRRLDLLVGFLSARMGVALDLGHQNVSPPPPRPVDPPPEALLARFRAERAEEFALYDLVARSGVLHRA